MDCTKDTLEFVIKWHKVCGIGQRTPMALLFRAMSCLISCVATLFQV